MSMHFLGYQGSCNENTSKCVSAFYWYKVVSMVWLSLCIAIRNKGVIFPLRKEKTKWVTSKGMSQSTWMLQLCDDKWQTPSAVWSLLQLQSLQQRRADPAITSPSILEAHNSFQLPQVKLHRNQVKREKQLWIWNLDGRNLSFQWKGQNTCSGVAKLRQDILPAPNKTQVAPITAT